VETQLIKETVRPALSCIVPEEAAAIRGKKIKKKRMGLIEKQEIQSKK